MRCLLCNTETQDGLIHEGRVICNTCLERLSEDLPLKKIRALIEYISYLEDAKLLLESASRFDFATDDIQKAISIVRDLLDRLTVRLVRA
jgi:hypothetical protein